MNVSAQQLLDQMNRIRFNVYSSSCHAAPMSPAKIPPAKSVKRRISVSGTQTIIHEADSQREGQLNVVLIPGNPGFFPPVFPTPPAPLFPTPPLTHVPFLASCLRLYRTCFRDGSRHYRLLTGLSSFYVPYIEALHKGLESQGCYARIIAITHAVSAGLNHPPLFAPAVTMRTHEMQLLMHSYRHYFVTRALGA